MRHPAAISILVVLLAGCEAAASSPAAPVASVVQTATLAPPVTPLPEPTPGMVAGWPVAAQEAFTMTGRTVEEEAWDGSGPASGSGPVIEVRITGRLAPGERVALTGTGIYNRSLSCGPLPSGCGQDWSTAVGPGQPYCMPEYGKQARGQVTIEAEPIVDASGSATATLIFEVPETQEACPVEGGLGWVASSGAWMISVSDPAHGLMLVPSLYQWGP